MVVVGDTFIFPNSHYECTGGCVFDLLAGGGRWNPEHMSVAFNIEIDSPSLSTRCLLHGITWTNLRHTHARAVPKKKRKKKKEEDRPHGEHEALRRKDSKSSGSLLST